MREPEMCVRLTASPWMDKQGGEEHGRIRIPKRARLRFQANGNRLVVRTGKTEAALLIKQARREDVLALRRALEQGDITEEQLGVSAFVTTETLNRFVGRRRKNLEDFCYVTDSVSSLMLGADPEFALVDPGTGEWQYAARVRGIPGRQARLGHDGPLAEIRPTPATDVASLVADIGKILREAPDTLAPYTWVAGATYRNSGRAQERVAHIGGHIHVGNPVQLQEEEKNAVYQRLIQVLDESVALPLVRIDTPLPHLRRNSEWNGYGRYGRWGDQKAQEGRVEWRVPSGLWLAHPTLTEAVLGTAKAVSESCYQLISEHGFNKDWISAPPGKEGFLKAWGALDTATAQKVINEAKPSAAPLSLVKSIEDKLAGMPNYEKYKAQIDEFFRIVRLSPRDRKNLSLNLKENWLNNGPLVTKE